MSRCIFCREKYKGSFRKHMPDCRLSYRIPEGFMHKNHSYSAYEKRRLLHGFGLDMDYEDVFGEWNGIKFTEDGIIIQNLFTTVENIHKVIYSFEPQADKLYSSGYSTVGNAILTFRLYNPKVDITVKIPNEYADVEKRPLGVRVVPSWEIRDFIHDINNNENPEYMARKYAGYMTEEERKFEEYTKNQAAFEREMEEFFRKRMEAEQRAKERARERARERERERAKEKTNEKTNEKAKTNRDIKEELFQEALRTYNVKVPYTVEEIKRIRKELVKQNHPDVGGSDEKCADINKKYDILLEYAEGR